MIPAHCTMKRVSTTDATEIDDLLNSAVATVIPGALQMNHGIKVTRTGPGNYVVETAPEVPCGYTIYEHASN